MAIALPPSLVFNSLSLPTKPNAPIRYAYLPPTRPSTHLLIYLNGLGLPQSSFHPSIAHLYHLRRRQCLPMPHILTYDRYGQGQTTSPDPADKGKPDGETHDAMDIVRDLHALIDAISHAHAFNVSSLILVGNSIGVPLSRLYAQMYPGVVSGLVVLDSNIANTDFVSIFPDPDEESSNEKEKLPPGVTGEALRNVRAGFQRLFHPNVRNPENFNRRTLRDLLPSSDGPKLVAPDGKGPFLCVVGHDPEVFAQEGEEGSMKTPRAVTMAYTNPYWHAYHVDMLGITDVERVLGGGVIIAVGAGHFIQRDVPEFVAERVRDVIDAVIAAYGE